MSDKTPNSLPKATKGTTTHRNLNISEAKATDPRDPGESLQIVQHGAYVLQSGQRASEGKLNRLTQT